VAWQGQDDCAVEGGEDIQGEEERLDLGVAGRIKDAGFSKKDIRSEIVPWKGKGKGAGKAGIKLDLHLLACE